MRKSVLIIVSIAASLSLISCSKQSKASSNTASMKTAFTMVIHPDYTKDVATVYTMYNKVQVVLVGKFEKDNKSYVDDHDAIETESHMKITKVLKGHLTDSEMKHGIDIAYYGGEVTLGTYVKNASPVPTKIDSEGVVHKPKQYSKQELESEKVVYKVEKQANADKDKNSEIMIFISRKPATNQYFVLGDAYGYRKINDKGEVFNPDTNSYDRVDFYPEN